MKKKLANNNGLVDAEGLAGIKKPAYAKMSIGTKKPAKTEGLIVFYHKYQYE